MSTLSEASLAQRRANVAQIAARRRAATRCGQGLHEMVGDNVIARDGRRRCRACAREQVEDYRRGIARQMVADPGHRLHGTARGYLDGRCRCFPCRIAASEHRRGRKAAA